MAAISDSSPLILYAKIGRLELLQAIFTEILIPPAVQDEILHENAARPGAVEVLAADWIRVQPVAPSSSLDLLLDTLDPGEAEAIALALQFDQGMSVLLDDLNGRRVAHELGLPLFGSGGLLVPAKRQGLLEAVRPVLDELRAANLYLGEAAYRAILALAGE